LLQGFLPQREQSNLWLGLLLRSGIAGPFAAGKQRAVPRQISACFMEEKLHAKRPHFNQSGLHMSHWKGRRPAARVSLPRFSTRQPAGPHEDNFAMEKRRKYMNNIELIEIDHCGPHSELT
jgi:hypothetical protein